VLTGSWDKTARLWDAATAQEIRAFKGHEKTVFSVAISPDGARVLTGSRDKTARPVGVQGELRHRPLGSEQPAELPILAKSGWTSPPQIGSGFAA
jgi:WD40 repeat protein